MVALLLLALTAGAAAQLPQNPSPMTENRRVHTRLSKTEPPGVRKTLSLGTFFVPTKSKPKTLLFFFHGGSWLPEAAAAQRKLAVVSIQIGAGSGVYSRAFSDPVRFLKLLAEAESAAGHPFPRVILGGWSAGNGAIRTILRDPASYKRVDAVLAIDGIHAGYTESKPAPEDLDIWITLARDAMVRRKRFLNVHSEIFPGTYASTTETADFLARQVALPWKPVLKWGPVGTQQLSEIKRGQFEMRGYAGNSAPDHVDLLHALPQLLKSW